MNKYCLYFQAHVPTARCWLFVGLIRSIEHMAFDRTFDSTTSTFEFLVPHDQEQLFKQFMHFCEEQKLIERFVQLPNRFELEEC